MPRSVLHLRQGAPFVAVNDAVDVAPPVSHGTAKVHGLQCANSGHPPEGGA